MSRYKLLLIAFVITLATAMIYSAEEKHSHFGLIQLKGSVNPVIADHIVNSIVSAQQNGDAFVLIEMDTPGGLVSSMREIIKAILGSSIPVVVYASPKGAQAASAGGFIMLSAHVAAMAPGTEIGAMHPVSPMLDYSNKDREKNGKGAMEKKVLNDTVAYARSLAQKRGRNVRWAEKAVREAISNTYKEALELNIIDIIAEDRADLMRQLNGRKVKINGGISVLKTRGLALREYTMDWKQRFMNYFADPQIIFLLLIIAVVGIGIEFKNPGMIIPGTIGSISLIVFLMSIQVIPINFIGLILIALAVVLFVLELTVPSYGLLTLGGIASFVAGSMILFDSPLPGGRVPLSSIIGAMIALMLIVFVVLRAVIRVHRGVVQTGPDAMIGSEARVLVDFTGEGQVLVHGEIWTAVSEVPLVKGDRVLVSEVKGMVVKVIKKEN